MHMDGYEKDGRTADTVTLIKNEDSLLGYSQSSEILRCRV